MHTRARALAVLLALGLLTAVVPSAAATAPPPTQFTRLRITATSSSDWTTISFWGVTMLDQVTVTSPAGATLVPNSRGFALRTAPGTPVTAVVDAVFEVGGTAAPLVRVKKGYVGSVQLVVDRTNDASTGIASVDTGDGPIDGGQLDTPLPRADMVGAGLQIAPVDPRRLVLAFYYPWFRQGAFDSGVWYDRPSGPYATDDPAAVATMLDQATGAEIDGFVVSWNGSAATQSRFDLLAQAAHAHPGFQLSTYLELVELQRNGTTDIGAIEAAAASALSRRADPSYLTVAGRPVLFVYGSWTITPSQWQTVHSYLAAQGYDPFVVGDSDDTAFGFDGFHLYNPNPMDAGDLRTFDWRSARDLRIPHVLHPDVQQRLWAATVSPGQNTVGRKGAGVYRARDSGKRYDQTWGAAMASNPEWILVTSWNEWMETTEIQPAVTAGWRALDQTTAWSSRFHS